MASISQIVKKYVGAPFGNLNESLVNQIPLNTPNRVNGASWNYGFPQITMQPVESGGKPPSGMDFNGVFNVLSSIHYNSQLGILSNEYKSGTSYPVGAVVVYPPDGDTNKSFFISLVDNNTYSPTNTSYWKNLFPQPILTVYPANTRIGNSVNCWTRVHPDGFIEQGGWCETWGGDSAHAFNVNLIIPYKERHMGAVVSTTASGRGYSGGDDQGVNEIGALTCAPYEGYGSPSKPLPLNLFQVRIWRIGGANYDTIRVVWTSWGY